MVQKQTKRLVLSGMFLALGLLLPFLTGQIPTIGSRLLPMHIPVLLCGFICGWPFGLLVGALTPLLRSIIFGMPPMMPTAVAMAFELSAYGALAGLLMAFLPRKLPFVYLALVGAMVGGRIVWGVASFLLYQAMGNALTWQLFFAGAVVNALPGILLQLLIVPPLALVLWRLEPRV